MIQYTPTPDVLFEPPNYRPGASVTLTCNVFGVTGPVSYRWSSTSPCSDNGCFASSSTSSYVSTSTLYWYDAGQHTCTVSDSSGNHGSSTTEMNIRGMIHILLIVILLPYGFVVLIVLATCHIKSQAYRSKPISTLRFNHYKTYFR